MAKVEVTAKLTEIHLDSFDAVAGWTCPSCGIFVWGSTPHHYCQASVPPPVPQTTFQLSPPDHTMLLTEIKGLLERLVELLAPAEAR